MQTNLPESFLATVQGQTAEQILRACVHCGFCTATCPTYQLLGDELDGPRGRIYQIKQVLEGAQPTRRVQQHLDRCLTCRSCETTCPSGVRYAQLLEIGREVTEKAVPRQLPEQIVRWGLRKVLPYPKRFGWLLSAGNLFRSVLPGAIKNKMPRVESRFQFNRQSHHRKVLVLEGCVQSVLTPDTNQMAARVFSQLGIEVVHAAAAGCCGAVSTHLCASEEGKSFMRRNIDAWWPQVEQGIEAIISTASGCGVMLHEYGQYLADDPDYAAKAARIASLVKDPVQVISTADLSLLKLQATAEPVAFHAPCTLQHGLKLQGAVEKLLKQLGFNLVDVADAHLCCGSAGTYSILQKDLSEQLLSNKVKTLTQQQPSIIVTANIGCQMHLQSGTDIPVKHWLSLLV